MMSLCLGNGSLLLLLLGFIWSTTYHARSNWAWIEITISSKGPALASSVIGRRDTYMKPSNLDHEGCGDHSSMAILSYLLSEAQHKLDRNICCSNPYSDGCGNHSKENTEGEVSDIPSTPYKLTHGSASTMSTLRVRCPWYGGGRRYPYTAHT